MTSKSLENMMTSDVFSKCTNYNQSECCNAVRAMLKTRSSSLNTSKYQMELSQGEEYNEGNNQDDGIGDFGVLFDNKVSNWEVMVTKGETALLRVASDGESSLYKLSNPCLNVSQCFMYTL